MISKVKKPPGRPRHRYTGNIKMDLKEVGINARNWINSAADSEY